VNDVAYFLFSKPIHFDTFMNIPDIKDMNGRGFQFKLKGFLDRHVRSLSWLFSFSFEEGTYCHLFFRLSTFMETRR